MGQIRVLSPSLISRIAAGECIERPASVVKELVENALDAGAARIDVALLDGGRELIRVVDDGGGMDADDLVLAVTQHATSKIRDDDDLFNIQTLGFRGEALASIASVARLRIVSRRADADIAHEIRVDGGEVGPLRPCQAPVGTTIEIRDLFFATPARRKFLKTNQTEVGHVTEQLARIALAQPGIAFSLRHQERVMHTLAAAGDRRQRIADFYGEDLARVLLDVRREGGGLTIDGLVAPPAESRGSGKWEYVFLNGRFIRDRFVSHAIKEAYRSLIDPHRFPVAFLFIAMNPQDVDVNVHPTKIEVRWRDSNYVHGQVLAALRDKFLGTRLDHTLRADGEGGDAYRDRVRQAMVDFFTGRHEGTTDQNPDREGGAGTRHGGTAGGERHEGTEARRHEGEEGEQGTGNREQAGIGRHEGGEHRRPGGTADQNPAREGGATGTCDGEGTANEEQVGAGATASAGVDGAGASAMEGPQRVDAGVGMTGAAGMSVPDGVADSLRPPLPPPLTADRLLAPRAIQIHRSYLVVETADGMMIIDQHALHERILYEELNRRIAQNRLESQRMLLPEIVRVPADRLEVLDVHADLLGRLGIELSAAGPQSVALQAFPTLLLGRVDVSAFVRDLLDILAEHGRRPGVEALVHDILDMMACKAAVKAGDALSPDEIAALIDRRETAERSSHCPHGRPTTLRLSLRDLERQFKRR